MSSWLDDAEHQLEVEAEQQAAIADAKTWTPKVGEVFKGTLMEGKYVLTKHGWSLLINVRDQAGQVWTVWCSAKLLKDALMTKHPAVGKGLAIKYNGKKKGKDFEYGDWVFDCEPATSAEEVDARAAYWRGVMTDTGEQSEVFDHKPTRSEQAGLTDPF